MLALVAPLVAALLAVAPGPATSGPEGTVLEVPYRSQLDGSAYQAANCGPTSVAMALAYFGVDASLWEVRVRAMIQQGSWVSDEGGYSDDYGVFIHHLSDVVEGYGLRTQGLWRREGARLDRLRGWSADDIRRSVAAGQPVVAQVRYGSLPERGGSYRGDHYVLVHGFRGDAFVYSDPLDRGGGGPGVTIAEGDLLRAMDDASAPRSAFAVYARPAR